MRKKFQYIIGHPLLSGSSIMIIGINGISGLNYIYHFAMGRFLGASAYGELVSLFSLIGLLGMLPAALTLAITKFVSSAKSKDEVYSLIVFLQKKTLLFSVFFIALSILMAPFAKSFLKLSSEINFILVGVIFTFSLFTYINRAVLQGVLRFKSYVLNVLFDNFIKLIGGVGFVLLGFSVFGALFAIVIGGFFSIFISFLLIRDYLSGLTFTSPKIKPFIQYSLPVFGYQLAIMSFLSSDLILVKHYFDPITAGNYSATSTIAKIIFFAAGPILSVMFPIISKRIANGVDYKKVFGVSVLLTLFVAVSGAIVFTFFAPWAVWLLFGKGFGPAVQYLPMFSLFMIILSLNNLFVGFFLSVNRTRIVFLPLLIAAFQIILITFFHQSPDQILLISVLTSTLLCLGLIVYSVYDREACFGNSTSIQTAKHDRKRSKTHS